ncbi:Ferric enterobactin esterase [Delftia tsuruhatensis]|uniref:alpha/beta hydrolase-fold protein n=1 Tax=Delftia tsuruhatensis TaxID=180282 RepID=UPI001E802ECF|nr:alpha/beta hydrolase-fold protein [Delftia tsuruhatensis]CAB5658813.1 Ferric enterobactin esterase [Delftia tsuruhatensis]CAC9679514.1 Ferric enterobactin esterase [Delftia tsuruhatensis]
MIRGLVAATLLAGMVAAQAQEQQAWSVQVDAEAGQLLSWRMDGGTHAHEIELLGPDGRLLRAWPATHNGIQEPAWVAPATGRYRLLARNPFFDAAPAPRWQLLASGPALADASPTAEAERPLSARLRQLQAELAQAAPERRAGLLQRFWQQVQATGTPLLEASPAGADEVLATFLWRAPEPHVDAAHRIEIEWAMRSEDSFTLQRLAGTDIWHLSLPLPRGLRAAYQLVVDTPQWPGADSPPRRPQRMKARQLASQRDVLNPHRWHAGLPGLAADGPAALHAHRSVLEIPAQGMRHKASLQPDATRPLAGRIEHLRFASHARGDERSLSLYLPPGTHAPGSLPLLVLFDREAYLSRVQIDRRLDQWIAQGRIPPLATLLIANPTQADRGRELPPNGDAFGDMLAHELLPWIRERHPQLARDAAQVVVAGSSYGGLAAGWMGFAHPDVFGNVLSLSGSYWWTPEAAGPRNRWAEGDWFMRQVAAAPARAVRWHLSAGLLERGVGGEGGLVDNNRHLRNVLQARGYRVSYREFAGGHDYYAWGEEIAIGLQALLGSR